MKNLSKRNNQSPNRILKGTNWVTRHNDVVLAPLKYSREEIYLLMSVLSLINPMDSEFQKYEIRIKDYNDFIGGSKRTKKQLEQIITKLFSRVIKIHDNPENPEEYALFHWIERPEFRKLPSGAWAFIVEINHEMKPYLLELGNRFSSIQLDTLLQFKIPERIRLYELLYTIRWSKSWRASEDDEWITYDKPEPLSYEYFVEKMELGKMLFAHFKRDIMNPLKEQMDKYCDWSFKCHEDRGSHNVLMALRFEFYDNNEYSPPVLNADQKKLQAQQLIKLQRINVEERDLRLYNEMTDFGISPSLVTKVLREHGYHRVKYNFEIASENIRKDPKIRDINAYVMGAILKNWSGM